MSGLPLASIFYHGTPVTDWKQHYRRDPPKNLPTAPISTKLPKQSETIRIVATFFASVIAGGALGIYLATKVNSSAMPEAVFKKLQNAIFMSGILAGVVGSGYVAITTEKSVDSLVHRINDIIGRGNGPLVFSTGVFEYQLTQNPNEKLQTALERVDWNQLPAISTATSSLDGRTVLLVKAKERATNKETLRVFVERLGARDYNHKLPIPNWIFDVLNAVYNYRHEHVIETEGYPSIVMSNSISPQMAQEFDIQVRNHRHQ